MAPGCKSKGQLARLSRARMGAPRDAIRARSVAPAVIRPDGHRRREDAIGDPLSGKVLGPNEAGSAAQGHIADTSVQLEESKLGQEVTVSD